MKVKPELDLEVMTNKVGGGGGDTELFKNNKCRSWQTKELHREW